MPGIFCVKFRFCSSFLIAFYSSILDAFHFFSLFIFRFSSLFIKVLWSLFAKSFLSFFDEFISIFFADLFLFLFADSFIRSVLIFLFYFNPIYISNRNWQRTFGLCVFNLPSKVNFDGLPFKAFSSKNSVLLMP